MAKQRRRTVIAVDDDDINLMILTKNAQDAGYTVKSFTSGETAWDYLENNPGEVDIAVLDKMMPGMSGIELLRRIKTTQALRHIPVIIQTGDVGVAQMHEGLAEGAYYYLTKPFHPEIFTGILLSADNECTLREELVGQLAKGHAKFIGLLQEGEFIIQTPEEASLVAVTLAQASLYPEFVAVGLMELLSNAIEHGNLEVGYDRKSQCLITNRWTEEMQTRLADPKYADRKVHIGIKRTPQGLDLTITDEGKGFDWQKMLTDDPVASRLASPNGRGMAKARVMLDKMQYSGKGNIVSCTISASPRTADGDEFEIVAA
jgi:CheY-like chemotaxis protein